VHIEDDGPAQPLLGGSAATDAAASASCAEGTALSREFVLKGVEMTSVVAVLVASLAFSGILMPPSPRGGGPAPPAAQATFLYGCSLAFATSVVAILKCFTTVPSQCSLAMLVRRWQFLSLLVWISMLAGVVAYLAASYIIFGVATPAGRTDPHWTACAVLVCLPIAAWNLLLFTSPRWYWCRFLLDY